MPTGASKRSTAFCDEDDGYLFVMYIWQLSVRSATRNNTEAILCCLSDNSASIAVTELGGCSCRAVAALSAAAWRLSEPANDLSSASSYGDGRTAGPPISMKHSPTSNDGQDDLGSGNTSQISTRLRGAQFGMSSTFLENRLLSWGNGMRVTHLKFNAGFWLRKEAMD
jgi:hypothetical protein